MKICKCTLMLSLVISLIPLISVGQEVTGDVQQQGKRYLDINIHSLDKYSHRLAQQQERLIRKLKRKERHFARKLQHKDSTAYFNYNEQTLSFDSIGKLLHPDSITLTRRINRKSNSAVDSLSYINSFLQKNYAGSEKEASGLEGYDSQLGKLKSELNYRSYINDLITQRTNNLKSLGNGTATGKIPGLTGMEKQVFYGKAKMKAFEDMADEPSKAEEKAMEYLQGTPGFSKYMNQSVNGISNLPENVSNGDMEKMGLQTKQIVQANLMQKYGKDLSGITGKIGNQVKNFQDKTNSLTKEVSKTKGNLKRIKSVNMPSFKVNPMRGLPFWKRIEKQYNWQTSRATIDGKPVILEMSAMAGFRHTLRLSYGLGIATDIGLGQNWSSIHLSYQGLGLRSYATWQWVYGIGVYAGYERMYKHVAFNVSGEQNMVIPSSSHSTDKWSEGMLVGLTKKYNINTKWNGALQVLYDIWWQQKGMRSPIVLRFTTQTK